jgi:hypothetical protein
MKLADVKIGGRYRCKVSGRLVTVRVTASRTAYSDRTKFLAVNESTGREITASPARLRYPIPVARCAECGTPSLVALTSRAFATGDPALAGGICDVCLARHRAEPV